MSKADQRTKPVYAASAARPTPASKAALHSSVALVLQGGGALGAYQGGVYEELAKAGYDPDWYAGISIGAINSAILAGNPAGTRLDRLREFWTLITSSLDWPIWPSWPWTGDSERDTLNHFSAATAITSGLPGFFQPRLLSPYLHFPGQPGETSFYDTSPLKSTLERLVDFDRINSGTVRLSLGAVNVTKGNYVFFDTKTHTIGPEHVMASAALPPSFPAIEINGQPYWDGGLVSNTPLFHVFENRPPENLLVFEVDLFSHAGPFPRDISQVEERRKDITFSSRTRENTTNFMQKHDLKCAILKLYDRLPPAVQQDPEIQRLREMGEDNLISLVHLIYRAKNYETQEKDYEFSRRSMLDHWEAGSADMRQTLTKPLWLETPAENVSLRVFDLTRDEEEVATAQSPAVDNRGDTP